VRVAASEIGALQASVEARIAQLRDIALDAYGTLRGIETAADDYRRDALRIEAGAEQAASDDLGAAAFLKARRSIRRASPR
jgi:hypothetical protein